MFNKSKKRGQGATEYLIILAVVIIIGLIVIAVLRNVPSQGTAAKARSGQSFWESTEIGFTGWAIDPTGVTIFVRNNQPNSITLTNLKFDSTNVYTTDTTIEAGEVKRLTSSTITCTAGNKYSYDVEIKYDDTLTRASYTFTGSGNKLEGTCASS